jgi:hypothetical protein
VQNAQQISIVQVENTAQVIHVLLQMNVILTTTVRDINKNVILEVANMTQTNVILTATVQDLIKNVDLEVAKGIGVKTQDRPEEQIQILEAVLGLEAMLPSNFRQ